MLDGSSPRVRGTRNHLVAVFSRCRFIPACAGNAISGCRARARPTVHPRVCGERLDPVNWVLLIVGSSPSVRGTPKAILDPFRARRFIPACAGNAIRSLTGRPDAPVHPRVCGERIKRDCRRMIRDGSSPRVRGTLNVHRLDKFHCRFIPACAGNAPGRSSRPKKQPVHPRVCGERITVTIVTKASVGSSPRVRGTPARPGARAPRARFIPACAGNASSTGRWVLTWTVHPRVCGERRPI